MVTKTNRSIYDLLADEFGTTFSEKENPEATSVGTASAVMLRQNPNRVAFYLINLSANAMYVRPDLDSSSSSGIFVAANGGFLIMNWRDDFTLPAKNWNLIAAGGSSNYYLIEIVAV